MERLPNSFSLPRFCCIKHTREIISQHENNKENRYNLNIFEDNSGLCQYCIAEGKETQSRTRLEFVTN
jgi:hypothetical protein